MSLFFEDASFNRFTEHYILDHQREGIAVAKAAEYNRSQYKNI
jgi:hypothetical protein